jgi:hypothetical protein
MRQVFIGLFAATACSYAVASSPWDGLWFYDAGQSHESDHTYTLSRQPDDIWHHDDGANSFPFAADGRPHPQLPENSTLTVTRMSERTFDYVVEGYGRVVERHHQELAADGKTLSERVTRTYPDGHEVEHATLAVRLSGTSGFEGTWKKLAKNPRITSATSQPLTTPPASTQPRRPYWVISTSSDGLMSWYIPATGDLIRGKADGKPRPITGPQVSAGTTLFGSRSHPTTFEFYARVNRHLIERATETLSPDGRTFTDALWNTGHEDEKDIRVFHKE